MFLALGMQGIYLLVAFLSVAVVHFSYDAHAHGCRIRTLEQKMVSKNLRVIAQRTQFDPSYTAMFFVLDVYLYHLVP